MLGTAVSKEDQCLTFLCGVCIIVGVGDRVTDI